jgi:Zn-dependent metalloprotease
MCRNPIQCILPPYVTKRLIEHPDPDIRAIGHRTLINTVRMHEQRRLLGAMTIGAPPGVKRRTIYNASNGTSLPGTLLRGEGDPASSDPAVNEAYDGLGATYDLFKEVYDRNSIDDRGLRLDASVHFDRNYDNAFWNGQQMVFGDGDGRLFNRFTVAIDVIGHELTHGVTEKTAGLEYHNESGALNESFSDVFGSLVKQYFLKQSADKADWLIGKGLLAPGIRGVALRSMSDPGTAFDDPTLGKDPQPGNYSDFAHSSDDDEGDFGGVHTNSGITNRAFYLVATKIGGNAWEAAGHIWYNTLLRLFEKADFQDCANISLHVAGELFGSTSAQAKAVREAWSEVGVAPATSARGIRKRGKAAAPTHELSGELASHLKRITEDLAVVVKLLEEKSVK